MPRQGRLTCQMQGKGRFPYRGTSRHGNQVPVLPTPGDAVQLRKARGDARHSVLARFPADLRLCQRIPHQLLHVP